MHYALLITGSPESSQAPYTALAFARALLARGHCLEGVFMYHDGVRLGAREKGEAQAVTALRESWTALHYRHGVSLDVCIGAASRRGVVDQAEAKRQGVSDWNLEPPFALTGLGQLITLYQQCDHVVTFAP